jgi:Protein of unknown function (DUF2442)/Domain of unknown function (DUF4160)
MGALFLGRLGCMPRISEFRGIAITMYVREHPPPHFHARYGEAHAAISIEDREREVTQGNFTIEMNSQNELAEVQDVEPLEGLWIRVTFTDGAVMEIGLEGVFGNSPGVFAPVLGDRQLFEQVRVNPHSKVVEWPGELDLDADVMYGKFPPVSGRDYERRIVRPASPSAA